MKIDKDKTIQFSKGVLYGRIESAIALLRQCVNDPAEKRPGHPDKDIMDCIEKLERIGVTTIQLSVIDK